MASKVKLKWHTSKRVLRRQMECLQHSDDGGRCLHHRAGGREGGVDDPLSNKRLDSIMG